jgi:hypothetical protein
VIVAPRHAQIKEDIDTTDPTATPPRALAALPQGTVSSMFRVFGLEKLEKKRGKVH